MMRASLHTARRLADYFVSKLPADKVAYWDLMYGDGSGQERDSSAASIAVCGLLELAKSLPAGADQDRYRQRPRRFWRLWPGCTSAKTCPARIRSCCTPSTASPPATASMRDAYGAINFFFEALTRVAQPDWKMYW